MQFNVMRAGAAHKRGRQLVGDIIEYRQLIGGPSPPYGMEDCEASNRPVGVREPHFKVFPEFVNASYMRRYELFCRKLVLERHYTAAAFLTSRSETGLRGEYVTPASDISVERFTKTLAAHISVHR